MIQGKYILPKHLVIKAKTLCFLKGKNLFRRHHEGGAFEVQHSDPWWFFLRHLRKRNGSTPAKGGDRGREFDFKGPELE